MTMPYTGPVCYLDGWHRAVDADGDKLYLEDDGSYRFAVDGDESWHDRKHVDFATVKLEDGSDGIRVDADELDAVKEFLEGRREQ